VDSPRLRPPALVLEPATTGEPHSPRMGRARGYAFAGGADAEVIGPPAEHAVQLVYELCVAVPLPGTRADGQRVDVFATSAGCSSLTVANQRSTAFEHVEVEYWRDSTELVRQLDRVLRGWAITSASAPPARRIARIDTYVAVRLPGGCGSSTRAGDAKRGSYPLSHLYGYFGLVRLTRGSAAARSW